MDLIESHQALIRLGRRTGACMWIAHACAAALGVDHGDGAAPARPAVEASKGRGVSGVVGDFGIGEDRTELSQALRAAIDARALLRKAAN